MANQDRLAISGVMGKNGIKPVRARRLTGAHMLAIGILIGALAFGGGMAIAGSEIMAYPTASKIFVDGKEAKIEAYSIDNSNYFKLRDLAQAIDVGVWYDEALDRVYVETDMKYDPKYNGVRKEPTKPTMSVAQFQNTVSVDVNNKKFFDQGKSSTEGYSANITVVELIRGEKAAEIVKSASSQNPAAGLGKEYILAWVRAKITDSKNNKYVVLSDIRQNMKCYSRDGASYSMNNPANINPILEQPTAVGDTVEGWIAFVVDRNDPEPRVQIGTLAGNADINALFALYN